jgi:ABC-type antimicrobial peptide transport system permease subunit
MNFLSGILNALAEVWTHKLRSILTITCVFLGVSSLVVVVGLLTGLVTSWNTWFAEYGGLEKVSVTADEISDDQKQTVYSTITLADAEAIRRVSQRVARYVSPEMDMEGVVRRGARVFKTNIQGVERDALDVTKYSLRRGRFISAVDNLRAERVAVLGSAVAEALFGPNEQMIGSVIDVQGVPFTVVGLLQHYELLQDGANVLHSKNEIMFVPITAMQKRLVGRPEINTINVQVDDVQNLGKLKTQLANTLFQLHRGTRGYKIETGEASKEVLVKSERGYFAVGGGVAAVSLLVGGIGIMNLMLASINERVREIGVRKAIGAWNRDIFVQFISEAIALSLIGGVAGLFCGVGVIKILQHVLASSSPPILSVWAIVVGFSTSVAIGVLSGLYPALQASRLDPIEALRYE